MTGDEVKALGGADTAALQALGIDLDAVRSQVEAAPAALVLPASASRRRTPATA